MYFVFLFIHRPDLCPWYFLFLNELVMFEKKNNSSLLILCVDDMKAVAVEFTLQGEDETQTGNLSPRCREDSPVTEDPEAGRNFELLSNCPLESSSDTAKTLLEAIADKEQKQTSIVCHPVRASSSTELNKSIDSKNNISPLPRSSHIPIYLPTPSIDSGSEIYQCNRITDKAKENDIQIDNSNESGGNTSMKVDATAEKDLRSVSGIEPCHETGPLREPTLSGDKVNRQWNTSNSFLRPSIFCLEHALEVEELLQCRGGANVLIICHSGKTTL